MAISDMSAPRGGFSTGRPSRDVGALDWTAMVLLIIGGLNWLLVGIADFNIVAFLFGDSALARIVYVLVGIAALYGIYYCATRMRSGRRVTT